VAPVTSEKDGRKRPPESRVIVEDKWAKRDSKVRARMVRNRPPLFELRAKSATFRVADGEPLEEVSMVSKGRFKGRELTSLQTVRIHPTGTNRDKQEGAGILYLKGNGRATYRVEGEIGSTSAWREQGKGIMTFSGDCTKGLRELANRQATFLTVVNARGNSTTRIWVELVTGA
jgi:hypothetical protein